MGFIGSVVKIGAAVAVVEIARRELSKPENQRKVRELVDKVQTKVRNVTQ